jgi:tetratricopeptide (TPR) repeat protein
MRTIEPKSAPFQAGRRLPSQRFRRTFQLLLLLFLTGAYTLRAGLQVKIQPRPVIVGERAQLQLISDSDTPRIARNALPRVPGLDWLGGPSTSQSIQIVNFRKTVTATSTYYFRVRKPGTYALPSFQVEMGSDTEASPRLSFKAQKRSVQTSNGQNIPISKLLYGRLSYDGAKRPPQQLFIGQEIALRLDIYVHQRLYQQMSYPEFNLENAAIRSFPQENPDNPKFLPPTRSNQQIGGQPFVVFHFVSVISPREAGQLSGSISTACTLVDTSRQSRDSFDDPFFGRFLNGRRGIRQQVDLTLPHINVTAPPPVPAGTHFLGLIGDWEISSTLKPQSVRVGEPLTLGIQVRGSGNPDLLVPPKLKFEGFRLYEPEVNKTIDGDTCTFQLNWVLLPLGIHSTLPELTLGTFSPRQGEYVTSRLSHPVEIQAPLAAESQTIIADSGKQSSQQSFRKDPDRKATDILYIQNRPGHHIRRPLWLNVWLPVLILLALAPLSYLTMLLVAVHREKMLGNRSYRRQRQALRQRGRVFKALKTCAPDKQAVLIREKLVPLLNTVLDLPPGTTIPDLTARLQAEHPELAQGIRQAEEAGFMPGDSKTLDMGHLLRLVGKLFFVPLLTWSLLAAPAADADSAPANSAQETLQKARQAYDRGAPDQAAELYRSLNQPGRENPVLLYNQANCAFRLGHPAEACALYERARRLAPRDSDIIENLNFARKQLGLPPVLPTGTPKELVLRLRALLRPDEWLLLAATLIFLWALSAGIQRLRRQPSPWLHTTAAGLIGLTLLFSWSQLHSSYQPQTQAIVTVENATVHSLPGDDTKELSLKLQTGEQVQIVEERTDWYRIRKGHSEGWIAKSQLNLIW